MSHIKYRYMNENTQIVMSREKALEVHGKTCNNGDPLRGCSGTMHLMTYDLRERPEEAKLSYQCNRCGVRLQLTRVPL